MLSAGFSLLYIFSLTGCSTESVPVLPLRGYNVPDGRRYGLVGVCVPVEWERARVGNPRRVWGESGRRQAHSNDDGRFIWEKHWHSIKRPDGQRHTGPVEGEPVEMKIYQQRVSDVPRPPARVATLISISPGSIR